MRPAGRRRNPPTGGHGTGASARWEPNVVIGAGVEQLMAASSEVQLPDSLRSKVLRFAAVMFWGGAIAALATLYPGEPTDAVNRPVIAACALLAIGGGAASWLLPWHRWHRNWVLVLTGGALALIAAGLLASGGAASPLFMLLALPVIFASAYYGQREAILSALAAAGVGVLVTLRSGSDHHVRFLIILVVVLVLAAGFQRMLVQALQGESSQKQALYQLAEVRRGELESSYRATLGALAAALDAKDRYTEAHGRETAALCLAVGRRLGLSAEELRYLDYGSLLHDIGKIGVPSAVLHKAGPLTPEEFAMMREHPVIGERILASVPFLAPVLPLVRHEHERYDGAGYPDGLKGEEIPIGARIILACDAYDAMSHDRPYRRALPPDRVLAELRNNAGTQFDPRVVRVLLEVITQGRIDVAPSAAAALPWAGEQARGPASWAQHLDSVQALGIRLARINSVQEVAHQIGEAIVRLMEYDQCRIYMADGKDLLKPAYASASRRPEYQDVHLSTFRMGEGIVGWVAETRQGVVIGDANRHPRKKRRNPFDESAVAVPVLFDDELIGVIAVVKLGLHQYHADHLRLLNILASQAAVSIANARMYERLTADASTDHLTGLLNRRAMQQRIDRAVVAEEAGFSLLVADIDHLKSLNDRFGHLVGDQALTAVADCGRADLRDGAVLARWGGDEFLGLLPGAPPLQAEQWGRTLQAALAAWKLASAPEERLSISFGIAHYPTHGRDVTTLLVAADRAMYAAKATGTSDFQRVA